MFALTTGHFEWLEVDEIDDAARVSPRAAGPESVTFNPAEPDLIVNEPAVGYRLKAT